MKSIHRALILGSFLTGFTTGLHAAESFAAGVVSYTQGSNVLAAYTNPVAALGKPNLSSGGTILSPFSPNTNFYGEANQVQIGFGGELTLRLSNYVLVDNTPGVRELGIWENVGLGDTNYPNGTAGSPATVFGADSAVIQVSADGVNWFSLNGGSPILFTLPGNFYANSTGAFATSAPPNPVPADFGQPFTGTLSDFNGKSYPQVLSTLNGSGGGTWLDIESSSGLTQVGYVRFSGVASGQTLEVDGVAINGTQVGTPVVPEPSSLGLLVSALALGLGHRFRQPCGA